MSRADKAKQQFNSQAALRQATHHHQAGQLQQAEQLYRQVLEVEPKNADALHLLGVIASQAGEYEAAVNLITQALEIKPNYADAHYNLGNVLDNQGRFEEAIDCYRRAIEVDPRYIDAYYNLGTALKDQGELEEAIAAYRRALEIKPDFGNALANLGTALLDQGRLDEAIACLRRALEIMPDCVEVDHNLRKALGRQIPSWHFPMLADTGRNGAYQRAIKKAVTGSSRVLDIGTGSGLLAMMAAKAGAAEVTACEMSKTIAEVAQQVIADNDLSGAVKLINKKSTALKIGVDMKARANVLVSEIVDVGLLGEGVVPTLRHALQNLVTPDAKVIPQAASVYAVLIETPWLRQVNPISTVSGFDLSAFDQLRDSYAYRQLHLKNEQHRPLTEPFHVKDFDFRNVPSPASESDPHRVFLETRAIVDGNVHAIAFWFDLYLDDDTVLHTGPDRELNCWGQAVQFFSRDTLVKAGERIALTMCHSDMRIWFAVR